MDEEDEGADEPYPPNEHASLPIPGAMAPILPSYALPVNEAMDYSIKKLKEALKARGISVKGKKQDIHCRLVKSIGEKVELVSSDAQTNAAGASFDPDTHCNLLEQDGSFVEEPMLIDGEVFHAPTVPEGESRRLERETTVINLIETF